MLDLLSALRSFFLFFLICLLLRLIFVLCIDKVPLMFLLDNFQNFVSALYEKNISFTMLQETFWDNDYVEGIEDFFLLFSYLFITQINICVLYR
jgi:hypothetical protein